MYEVKIIRLSGLRWLGKNISKPSRTKVNTIESQIKSHLEKGYLRELDEEVNAVRRCWYLHIFSVSNPNKPQKIRSIWDTAAKAEGCSVNSALLKGTDLLLSLPGVFMRFRE